MAMTRACFSDYAGNPTGTYTVSSSKVNPNKLSVYIPKVLKVWVPYRGTQTLVSLKGLEKKI